MLYGPVPSDGAVFPKNTAPSKNTALPKNTVPAASTAAPKLSAEQYSMLFGETPPLPTEVLSGWTIRPTRGSEPAEPKSTKTPRTRRLLRWRETVPGANALATAGGEVVSSVREHPMLSVVVLVVSLGAGMQLAGSGADTPTSTLATQFVEVESARSVRASSTEAPPTTITVTTTIAPSSAPPTTAPQTTAAPTTVPPTTATPATASPATNSVPPTTAAAGSSPATTVASTPSPTTAAPTTAAAVATPLEDVPVTGSLACHSSYDPCIPDLGTDVDCRNSGEDGPRFTGPVTVSGADDYQLDPDGDGIACAGT